MIAYTVETSPDRWKLSANSSVFSESQSIIDDFKLIIPIFWAWNFAMNNLWVLYRNLIWRFLEWKARKQTNSADDVEEEPPHANQNRKLNYIRSGGKWNLSGSELEKIERDEKAKKRTIWFISGLYRYLFHVWTLTHAGGGLRKFSCNVSTSSLCSRDVARSKDFSDNFSSFLTRIRSTITQLMWDSVDRTGREKAKKKRRDCMTIEHNLAVFPSWLGGKRKK